MKFTEEDEEHHLQTAQQHREASQPYSIKGRIISQLKVVCILLMMVTLVSLVIISGLTFETASTPSSQKISPPKFQGGKEDQDLAQMEEILQA